MQRRPLNETSHKRKAAACCVQHIGSNYKRINIQTGCELDRFDAFSHPPPGQTKGNAKERAQTRRRNKREWTKKVEERGEYQPKEHAQHASVQTRSNGTAYSYVEQREYLMREAEGDQQPITPG